MTDREEVPTQSAAVGRPALQIRGLTKTFGSTRALQDVSLDIAPGTIHALLGGNGSGKSTLIKILAGVQAADAGQLQIADRIVKADSMTPEVARDSGLRFVHQQNSTFGTLTVSENLRVGHGFERRFGAIDWPAVRRRTQEVLDRFGIHATPDQDVAQLSRATQTMLAIARALQDQESMTSSVLVLDEPTSSLPRNEVETLFEALQRYAADGQTILFVTHRFDEVVRLADQATMLRDGRRVGTVERGQITEAGLVELMLGRSPRQVQRSHGGAGEGAVRLSCRGLRRGPLRDIALDVRAGEIVGVAGLLGSGRSTLLRSIFGLEAAEEGEVHLDGERIRLRTVGEARYHGIAYVPEDRVHEGSFSELSVLENLSMTTLPRYWQGGRLRHRRERAEGRATLERFRVKAASEDAVFGTLSGGNQQKVILARWLSIRPRVLLLDEPTQGVDVGARVDIYDLVRQAVDSGTSVLIVSSELQELELLCDRVIVLRDGSVACEVTGSDIKADVLERLVQAGVAA